LEIFCLLVVQRLQPASGSVACCTSFTSVSTGRSAHRLQLSGSAARRSESTASPVTRTSAPSVPSIRAPTVRAVAAIKARIGCRHFPLVRLDCRVLSSPLHCVTRHSAGCRSRPFRVSKFGFTSSTSKEPCSTKKTAARGLRQGLNFLKNIKYKGVTSPRLFLDPGPLWRHSSVLRSGAGLRQKVAEQLHAVWIVEGDLLVVPAKRRCSRRPSTPHVAQLSASPPRRRCRAALRLLRTCVRARARAWPALGLKAGRSNGSTRSGGQTS
jgi:hypothetical protein